MRINTLLSVFILSLSAFGCGAGGGGSSSSGNALTSPADINATLQASNWLIQPETNEYGYCAYAAKFLPNGRFGISQLCESAIVNGVFFEVVAGTYTVADGNISLTVEANKCSALANTALREALGLDSGMKFKLVDGKLLFFSGTKALAFSPNNDAYMLSPMAKAARGCNEKSASTFEWQSYISGVIGVGQFDSQFKAIIEKPETPVEVVQPPIISTLQMSNSSGRVTGTVTLSSGNMTGVQYSRTSNAGDRIDLYVLGGINPSGGSGNSNVSASAKVLLTQSTIDAFDYYCEAQPTTVEFYLSQLTNGNPGKIDETVKLWAKKPSGTWCYGIL